jgi:hypothetical protein
MEAAIALKNPEHLGAVGPMSVQSKPALFVCEGFNLANYRMPAFEVRAGELVKLELPNEYAFPHRELLRLLSAPAHQKHVRAAGKVMVVEWIRTRPPFLEIFHRQRASEWLCRRTGLPPSQAMGWLKRVGLQPDVPLASFAGATPRRLLAIQAAFALKADIIIFDTEGLDPPGVGRTVSAIHHQLGDAAAVCLTWFDEVCIRDIPFAAVHTVPGHTPQPTAS